MTIRKFAARSNAFPCTGGLVALSTRIPGTVPCLPLPPPWPCSSIRRNQSTPHGRPQSSHGAAYIAGPTTELVRAHAVTWSGKNTVSQDNRKMVPSTMLRRYCAHGVRIPGSQSHVQLQLQRQLRCRTGSVAAPCGNAHHELPTLYLGWKGGTS